MLRGTYNSLQNIRHIRTECKEYSKVLSIPQNIVMDLNNIMHGAMKLKIVV